VPVEVIHPLLGLAFVAVYLLATDILLQARRKD
jgi:hypothetical protein